MINLNNTRYLDQQYSVGNEKRSIAMMIPSPILKTPAINPKEVLLYPWVKVPNNLVVRILGIKGSEIEEIHKRLPAEKFPRLDQQAKIKIVKVVD